MFKKYYVIIFIFICCSSHASDVEQSDINIINWQVLYKNTNSLSEISDNDDWKHIALPETVHIPYAIKYGTSNIWLRGTLNIENQTDPIYGLYMDRMISSYRIYINRELAVDFKPDKPVELFSPNMFLLPDNISLRENNTVHINIKFYGKKGYISGPLTVLSEEKFEEKQALNTFFYKQIPIGLAFLFLTLIIILVKTLIIKRKLKYFLYIIYLLIRFFTLLIIFTPFSIGSLKLLFIVLVLSAPLNYLLVFFIIQAIYNFYLSNHNKIFIPFIILIEIALILNPLLPSPFNSGVFLLFLLSICVLLYYIFLVLRLNKLRPDRFIKSFIIIFLLTAFSFNMLQYYGAFFKTSFSFIFHIMITPVYIILISIYEIRESLIEKRRNRELYNSFTEYKKEKSISITDPLKEKLARVEDFIKDNSTYDISREGLAAMADLNPDYFSRAFKHHTGKKVNEFINDLRIRKAERELIESKTSIFQIASLVGYNNLRSFNRAFKETMGLTPSEYRKKKSS